MTIRQTISEGKEVIDNKIADARMNAEAQAIMQL